MHYDIKAIKIDFILFIEHIARELDVACLLKLYLKKYYNMDLVIMSFWYDLDFALMTYDPKVIILPWSYTGDDIKSRDAFEKWPNAIVVNLCNEQIYSAINSNTKSCQDTFSKTQVLHHAWGDYRLPELLKQGIPQENIFINGNPNYTLYKKPYRDAFLNKKQISKIFNLDCKKKWLFIPDNYGIAFFSDGMLLDYIHRGTDPKDAVRFRSFASRSMSTVVPWIKLFAKEFEVEVEVIVRPRPAIPIDKFIQSYKNLIGKKPKNLHIIKDGTVREWVLASDVVISSYSTTLLEGSAANKPVFMFQPEPFPRFLKHKWQEHIPKIVTYEDMKKINVKENNIDIFRESTNYVNTNLINNRDCIKNLTKWLSQLPQRYPKLIKKTNATAKNSIIKERQLIYDKLFLKDLLSKMHKFDLKNPKNIWDINDDNECFNTHSDDKLDCKVLNKRINHWNSFLSDFSMD